MCQNLAHNTHTPITGPLRRVNEMPRRISAMTATVGRCLILLIAIMLACCNTESIEKSNLVLGKYGTAGERADAILRRSDVYELSKFNLPTESVPKFGQLKVRSIGGYSVAIYTPRYQTPKALKSVLEQVLEGTEAKVITEIPETNQLMIKFHLDHVDNESVPLLDAKELGKLLAELDVAPPQIGIDVKIYKLFADHTFDISAVLKANSEKDLLPFLNVDLRGSQLRTPEREFVGSEHGVLGKLKDYVLRATLDTLLSKGFAEELAGPSLVVTNTYTAKISKTEKVPIPSQTIVGSSVIGTTRFEEVNSFLEVTPQAAAEGEIYLAVRTGTASVNPAGPIQTPVISTRQTDIAKVRLQQGRTLAIASFLDNSSFAVDRESPLLVNLPWVGELFKGQDQERSRDMILFLVRPYFIYDGVDIETSKELGNFETTSGGANEN